jgi:DNA-binding NarL/FixJ family response regulator
MISQPEMTSYKRVLIVDDHSIVIEGLSALLEQTDRYRVCGSASSSSEGLQKAKDLAPDMMIIDLSLKNSHGLDLIKDIHMLFPTLPMIVLSMLEETVYAERTIRAGAKGYIMKDQVFDCVVEALDTIASGDLYLSHTVKEHIIKSISAPHSSKPLEERLSDKELIVLTYLSQGLRPRHIADRMGISPRTVDTYYKRIQKKMNMHSIQEVIDYVSKMQVPPG